MKTLTNPTTRNYTGYYLRALELKKSLESNEVIEDFFYKNSEKKFLKQLKEQTGLTFKKLPKSFKYNNCVWSVIVYTHDYKGITREYMATNPSFNNRK